MNADIFFSFKFYGDDAWATKPSLSVIDAIFCLTTACSSVDGLVGGCFKSDIAELPPALLYTITTTCMHSRVCFLLVCLISMQRKRLYVFDSKNADCLLNTR